MSTRPLQMMHGQFIGARRVRCGWAQHKTDGIVAMDPQVRCCIGRIGVLHWLSSALRSVASRRDLLLRSKHGSYSSLAAV